MPWDEDEQYSPRSSNKPSAKATSAGSGVGLGKGPRGGRGEPATVAEDSSTTCTAPSVSKKRRGAVDGADAPQDRVKARVVELFELAISTNTNVKVMGRLVSACACMCVRGVREGMRVSERVSE